MPTEECDGVPDVASVTSQTICGITKPDNHGVVTAAETSVEEKATKAHGADFPKLAGKVAVTKLWMHCRGSRRQRCRSAFLDESRRTG